MNSGYIKLSHFSVKEYLLSTRVEDYFRIDEKTSHSKISQLSIAYLLQLDHDDDLLLLTKLWSIPLAQYAAVNWIDHAKSGGVDSTVLQLILCLFTFESAPLKKWIQLYNMYNIESRYEHLPWDVDCSVLYYSSLAGIQEVSDCLLNKGENPNAKGGRLGNPLQAASYKG